MSNPFLNPSKTPGLFGNTKSPFSAGASTGFARKAEPDAEMRAESREDPSSIAKGGSSMFSGGSVFGRSDPKPEKEEPRGNLFSAPMPSQPERRVSGQFQQWEVPLIEELSKLRDATMCKLKMTRDKNHSTKKAVLDSIFQDFSNMLGENDSEKAVQEMKVVFELVSSIHMLPRHDSLKVIRSLYQSTCDADEMSHGKPWHQNLYECLALGRFEAAYEEIYNVEDRKFNRHRQLYSTIRDTILKPTRDYFSG